MRIAPTTRRRGLTLLEVLLSMAILLIFLTAISQLLDLSTRHALKVQELNQASQLLQSQMNRVICGELPLSSHGETAVEDDPDWTWSMDCEAESTPNLWHVTITVNHTTGMASADATWTLEQLVLDPTVRGTIQAPASSSSSSAPATGGP